MAKDPAFLFYSKDWIEGTADMTKEEKGLFIDLLAHQHQRGHLPADTKRLSIIAGLSHDEFMRLWDYVGLKFERTVNQTVDVIINQRLRDVMDERHDKGKKNKLTGTFAAIIRLSSWNRKQQSILKTEFTKELPRLLNDSTEWSTERLTDWLVTRLKSIEDGNGSGSDNGIEEEEGGNGGKQKPSNAIWGESEEWNQLWQTWLEYKRSQHGFRYKSPKSEQAGMRNLYEMSYGNLEIAGKILQQTIGNGWQGLQPLKSVSHGTNNGGKHRKQLEQEAWERFVTGESVYGGDG